MSWRCGGGFSHFCPGILGQSRSASLTVFERIFGTIVYRAVRISFSRKRYARMLLETCRRFAIQYFDFIVRASVASRIVSRRAIGNKAAFTCRIARSLDINQEISLNDILLVTIRDNNKNGAQ